MRVSDATLAEVRERGFSLMEGFLSDAELSRCPRGALAALPASTGLLRGSRCLCPLRGEPVCRSGGVSVPLLGSQPVGRASRPGGRGRALPGDDRAAPLQGGALGEVRRSGQLRPTVAPGLREPQPGGAASGVPIPAVDDLRLLVRRHRGRRAHADRSLRGREGRALHAVVHAVRIAAPMPRWHARGRPEASSSTGPTFCIVARK